VAGVGGVRVRAAVSAVSHCLAVGPLWRTTRTRREDGSRAGEGRVQMSEFSWTSGWPLQIINSRRRRENTKTTTGWEGTAAGVESPLQHYHHRYSIPLPPPRLIHGRHCRFFSQCFLTFSLPDPTVVPQHPFHDFVNTHTHFRFPPPRCSRVLSSPRPCYFLSFYVILLLQDVMYTRVRTI